MNKKVIGIILIVILVCVGGLTTYYFINKNNKDNGEKNMTENNNNNNENKSNTENSNNVSSRILVAYYSAQNHTRDVAILIANELKADIFEIVPREVYTEEDLDWTNEESRVSKEHGDAHLMNVKLTSPRPDNFDDYDIVLIGYPIWWGIAAWPVNNFVKLNDFEGKIVIPFCTSASSGLGESAKLLSEKTTTGDWLEGHRFSSNATSDDVKAFIDNLKELGVINY